MSRALKHDDLLGLSKLYESEFNKPDLHDRILVFDVVATQRFSDESVEENVSDENKEPDNEATQASKESDDEATRTDEMGMSTSDEKEPQNEDCEIASKYTNSEYYKPVYKTYYSY